MVFPASGLVNGRDAEEKRGVRGWLLLLCLLLLVGQPLSLAVSVSGAMGALPIRGLPLALVIVARILVAALGVGAGIALVGVRPGAVRLAQWSLGVSAAMDTFVDATSFYPSNRLPGATPFVMAISLAYYALWLAYLSRSRRVQRTFPE
jgi:hypothetical protein